MSGLVIWIPEQEGYLLDEDMPDIVTSYAWHAKHYAFERDAERVAANVGGIVKVDP